MKVLSVFGSIPQVIKRLQKCLAENDFRHIEINTVTNEITAERRMFLVWKDYVRLKVNSAQPKITNIELTLNPYRKRTTESDDSKEQSLLNRIYLYF